MSSPGTATIRSFQKVEARSTGATTDSKPTPTATIGRKTNAFATAAGGLISLARGARAAATRRVNMSVKKTRSEQFSTLVRDPDGEKRVGDIARECKAKGIRYTDPEFGANEKSIFLDPRHPTSAMLKIHKELPNIKWLRPHEMGDPAEPPQVFAEGIEPEDINQGSIGDCYFLAALAICATREELILDLIVEDFADQGIFGVKMYWMGEWHTIIVDDLLPCRKEGDQWMPVFARWKGTKETWAMIAEKAWAKVHGSYEAINGGHTEDALAYLSGGCSSTSTLDDEANDGSLWDRLVANHRLNSKDMGVFISTSGVDEAVSGKGGLDDPGHSNPKKKGSKSIGGLVSGHAYSILDIQEVHGGHKVVQLRNPWGSYEWDGDWGDHSSLWTPERKAQVNFVAADDGSFWMSLEDYRKNFGHLGICKTVPTNWNNARMSVKWTPGLSSGGPRDKTFSLNPTFKIFNHSKDVWITIEQEDVRGKFGKHLVHTFCYIFKHADVKEDPDTGGRTIVPAQALSKRLELGDERIKTTEFSLDPKEGPYYIVVSPWFAGIEGSVSLVVTSAGKFDLTRCKELRPTSEQAVLMKAMPMRKDCATCSKPVDPDDFRALKGVNWHNNQACNKCGGCGKPFKMSVVSDRPVPGLQLFEVGYTEGKGWAPYCFECYNPKFGERCLQCNKPLLHFFNDKETCLAEPGEGKIHQECAGAYQATKSEKCAHCSQPVCEIAGKFSGQYYTSDMGSGATNGAANQPIRQVHMECWDAYERDRAIRCLHCKQAVCAVPGKFSGSFFPVDSPKGQVHEECMPEFQRASAPKCVFCNNSTAEQPGKYSGKCFVVENDKRLHEECQLDYHLSRAQKCFQCNGPVYPVPGKYSGSYFSTEAKQPVHVECKQQYYMAKAKKCAHCKEPVMNIPGKFTGSYYPDEKKDAVVHEECWSNYQK